MHDTISHRVQEYAGQDHMIPATLPIGLTEQAHYNQTQVHPDTYMISMITIEKLHKML
jgi:hypothetical protein